MRFARAGVENDREIEREREAETYLIKYRT